MQAQGENDAYRSTRTREIDIVHTKLEVSFDWEKQYLHGTASLDVTTHFFPQSEFDLDAKGMSVHSVELYNGEQYETINHSYSEDKIGIVLAEEMSSGDTLSLRIKYTAKPNERMLAGSNAIKSDKGLYFINPLNEEPNKPQQIWTQGETESNSVWFPTIDSPNEKSTQEMYITVQNRFKTLSNGLLVESMSNEDGTRTDYWVMDLPHSPYLFMMAVGEFEVVEDIWNDLPLSYWVEPEYAPFAKDIFGHTPEMLSFFSDLLGVDFPWQKYAQIVVRDYVSGAMENSSASVFMDAVQATKRDLIDRHWDDYIAHELFHQWFGDLVTTESWSNLTLNEGFATYSEYLWDDYKYGRDEAEYNYARVKNNYLTEAKTDPKSLIRFYYDDREDMFDRHSYDKGGWVIHMLRHYVGDEAFFAALHLYLTRHAFKNVEVHDLRLAFEEVTGEDLNWFFDQWFILPGHPKLDVRHNFQDDTLYVSVNQVQKEDVHLFRLPVFLDIWKNGEQERYPLIIEQESEIYKFPMNGRPDLVVFDPENQLLAEIDHPKREEELQAQYELAGNYHLRLEAVEKIEEFKKQSIRDQLLDLGLTDPHYNIRLTALEHISNKVVKQKKYEEKLVSMTNDSSSHVRVDVLFLLHSINAKKYEPQLIRALGDSSHYVSGSALQLLADSKDDLSQDLLEGFMKSNNENTIMAIAGYFSTKQKYPNLEWYESKLSLISGSDLFYFIQYYAERLLTATEKEQLTVVDEFENLAQSHQNYLVRLSAYQAMLLFSDIKGVEKRVVKVRESEKDQRLIDLYDNL